MTTAGITRRLGAQALLVLLLGGLGTVSCAELAQALAGGRTTGSAQSQPATTTAVAQPPTPPAPQPAPDARWITVDALAQSGASIRLDGRYSVLMGTGLYSVFVDRCVFDQAGYGVCAAGGEQSPEMYSSEGNYLTFQHVVAATSTDLHDFLVLRPQGGSRPESQVVAPWLRLVWSGADEVAVQPLGVHGASVAVEFDENGTLAARSLPALEFYDPSARRWNPCSGTGASEAVLLIRLDTPVTALLVEEMKEAVGPEGYYNLVFPNAPEACDWRTEGVRLYDDDVTEVLAAVIPEDPSAALEAAGLLYGTWWNVGVQAQQQDAAALAACGWTVTDERKQAVATRLFELATRAGSTATSSRIAQWAQVACEAPGSVCDQFVALGDARLAEEEEQARQRAEQQQVIDDFFTRADALQLTCDQCTESAEYDHRQLQFDCYTNELEEACRRLNRAVESRCSDECAPTRRCDECIRRFRELVDEVGRSEAERQAVESCERDCR
ncbi:MAG: hypothetical protein HY905_04115 [Deltaproteobacteria bacterium]|nr:hypothetical protein [Deltaproteobacteria bacterium]